MILKLTGFFDIPAWEDSFVICAFFGWTSSRRNTTVFSQILDSNGREVWLCGCLVFVSPYKLIYTFMSMVFTLFPFRYFSFFLFQVNWLLGQNDLFLFRLTVIKIWVEMSACTSGNVLLCHSKFQSRPSTGSSAQNVLFSPNFASRCL